MATAVLLPQDCLRPRSRHKHRTSGMIFSSDCAPRSKRTLLAPVDVQEAGLLPLPGYGRHSSPMNIPRKGSDADHFKSRKAVERGGRETFPDVAPDVPVYKILQRPKQGNTAVELPAQFVMVDEIKAPEFHDVDTTKDGSKVKGRASDMNVVKLRNVAGSACQPKDVSKYVNGMRTLSAEGYKLPNMKVGALKPKVITTNKVHDVPDDSARPPASVKPSSTRAAGKVKDSPCMAGTVRRSGLHESLFLKGSTRLRRSSTEPQIPVHVLGQCRSNLKSESQSLLSKNAPFSCQERWAGPAYTSSPSPSSLPLPKLCLRHPRFSSLEIPSLVKQYSTSVYMQPFLGSSAPSENGGAWDVAFATKSLRKMLHLDPC